MWKLRRYLKPYKKQLIIGPFFKLCEAVLELLLPMLMAYTLDHGVSFNDRNLILRVGILMFVIALVGLACALVCQYSASIASQGFGTHVRNAIFAKINTFSNTEIEQFGESSLVNRVTNDVNVLQQAVAMLIRLVIRAPFLCIGGFILAATINVHISMLVLIAMILFVVVIMVIMKKTVPLYQKAQEKLDHLTRILRENLTGIRVIRAFARTGREKERFYDANKQAVHASEKVGRLSAVLNPGTMLILNFATAGILWYSGIQVNIGGMSQGEIIAFITYMTQILQALLIIANLVVLFTRAAASGIRVNEVLETVPRIQDRDMISKEEEKPNKPVILFDDVSFHYPNASEEVLSHISFSVEKGETLGIIGGTGSGKSTLSRLIPRLYDLTAGKIYLCGMDIQAIPLQTLRTSLVGVVLQKANLFYGTIAQNIRWGKPDATDEEVREAAKAAQASEFIEKKSEGYDTIVERGGTNLSGGQKQRLSIARALVRKPRILILDDSSSALDYGTDARLRKSLRTYTEDSCVVIVSQRVSSVRYANKILVMDEGRQVGYGTHDHLLAACDTYREIYESQTNLAEATNI